MYSTEKTDEIIGALKNTGQFENVEIIKAYPYSNKPTKTGKCYIVFYPCVFDLHSVGIGQEIMYGSFFLDFAVFSPFELGSPAVDELTKKVINSLKNYNLIGIKTQGITVDNTVKCYKSKCTVEFDDYVTLGGDLIDGD